MTAHAREQMLERGAAEAEVVDALRTGAREPVRHGRFRYEKTFPFGAEWRGRAYALKKVEAVVAEERSRLVVITVYTFYF